MAKEILSLEYIYSRDTKNFHVYKISKNCDFFPKEIYLSDNDVKETTKKVTLTITEG